MNCHTQVASEIASKTGLHASIDQACASCHPDHRGRTFDMSTAALSQFNHTKTKFSLVHHGINYDATPMDCSACHKKVDLGYPFELNLCVNCHAQHDLSFMTRHIKDFGLNCVDCHDGKDIMVDFDHQKSKFPLTGAHVQVSCAGCHKTTDFKGTPTQCSGCHADPDVHKGSFAQPCSDCHSTSTWLPATLDGASFEHTAQTGFSLVHHAKDYQGQPLNCQGCHNADIHKIDTQTCTACHGQKDAQFMAKHQDQYGPKCLDCHDGADRMSNFDHASFFPLEGKHAEIECTSCHANQVYKGTPQECHLCHQEPAVHAGFFGLNCQDCHTARAWSPALLKAHKFPLSHGGAPSCQTCHLSNYVEYTCYGCHDHLQTEIMASHLAIGVSLTELPNCTKCHPAGTN
jgi:hypothetical protein